MGKQVSVSCLSTDGVRRKHFSWSMYEKPPRNNSGTKNTKKSYLLGKPVFMPYLPTDGVCRKHCLCSIHEDHSPELIQVLKIQKNYSCGENKFLCPIFQPTASAENTAHGLYKKTTSRINSGTKNT